MKSLREILTILAIAYAVVMLVNFAANGRYYLAGEEWQYSVFFSLSITTLGVLGGTIIMPRIFRNFRWSSRPTLKIVLSMAVYGIYGAAIMLLSMNFMEHVLGFKQSAWQYVNNTIYSVLFSLIIGLVISGRAFLLHLKRSIEDNERMKQEMVQSRYETLKNQVNPHFLFNSLNTLAAIIPEDTAIAVQFVEQLSKVFRYSLQYSNDNVIDVATELKVVRSYLFINEQRFGGKLKVSIHIDDLAMSCRIITQSLLMLVENAIKHNEISTDNPLSLHIFNENEYLVVRNTLQRRKLVEQSTHVGLDNIRKRYELLTATPVLVEEGSRFFTVGLPLMDQL